MPRPAGKGGEDFLLGVPDVTGLNQPQSFGPDGGEANPFPGGTGFITIGDRGEPIPRGATKKPREQKPQGQGAGINVNKQLSPAGGSGTGGRGVFSPEERRGRQTVPPSGLFKRVNERGA